MFCGQCGLQSAEGTRYCGGCGAQLHTGPGGGGPPRERETPPGPSPDAYPEAGAWIGLAACFIVTLLCIFAWLFAAAEMVGSGAQAFSGYLVLTVVTVVSALATYLIWGYIAAHEPRVEARYRERHRRALTVAVLVAVLACGLGIRLGLVRAYDQVASRGDWLNILFGR
jgi:hypothetical protein